jgi:16S rRNA (adenine(1408)-N(1))-methyltransferase
VRRVLGRQVVEMSEQDFDALRAGYRAVLLDVGTGDGKHAAQLARRHPDLLVVGLDANRENMRRVSARAAASPARGGLPNALFVWAAAERLPAALREVAALHLLMPWGSLLRGLLGTDPTLLRQLAVACRPGAEFLVALNLHAWRPPVPEVGDLPEPTPDWARGALAAHYAAAGWRLAGARYLDAAQIAGLATSWTRRLTSARDRFDVLALSGTIG